MSTVHQYIEARQKLIEKFVAKVCRFKEVKKILIVDNGGVPRLWTVLDAKPWDWEVQRRIFEIESQTLRALDQPLLDFRLINLSEIEEDQHPYVIPDGAKLLYERQ